MRKGIRSPSLQTCLEIDREIAHFCGWRTAEDIYYDGLYREEMYAETAYERWLDHLASEEHHMLEREAPWAI